MGVLSSNRTFTGASTDVDENSARTHSLKWNVKVDSQTMTGVEVLVSARGSTPDPVPDLYDPMPGDSVSRCKGLSAKQSAATPLLWEVEAKYDSKYTPIAKQSDNPNQRPAIYTIEFQQFQKVLQTDINSRQICNTLQQTLVPAVEVEDSRPILVIQKNFSSLSQVIAFMLEYKDAINDRPFYGAARHQAKIKSITAAQAQFENGFSFIPVTMRIEFKGQGDTWDRVLLNTAMRFYRNAADFLAGRPLTDMLDGVRVSEPVPIDENGIAIARDSSTNQLVRDPVYTTFQIFPDRNFSLLGI